MKSTKAQASSTPKYNPHFLRHPRRSPILSNFDIAWRAIHDHLAQLDAPHSPIGKEEVYEDLAAVQEFIGALTTWKARHQNRDFLPLLAYSHFLAGVLAVSWVLKPQKAATGHFKADPARLLPEVTQSALDHLHQAKDLETKIETDFAPLKRSAYSATALNAALAMAYEGALDVKPFLKCGDAPFMRVDLTQQRDFYRREADVSCSRLTFEQAGWLPTCVEGLFPKALASQQGRATSEQKFIGESPLISTYHAVLKNRPVCRLLYLWNRMHTAYLELEAFEYKKAAMAEPNWHCPTIMPALSGDQNLTWPYLKNQNLGEAENKAICGKSPDELAFACLDQGAVIGMIFGSASLQIYSLFLRVLYARKQMRRDKQSAEAAYSFSQNALDLISKARIKSKDKQFLKVTLTACLAEAEQARAGHGKGEPGAVNETLKTIETADLKSLKLHERWFFHRIAKDHLGGNHASLATRGRKLTSKHPASHHLNVANEVYRLMQNIR